MRTIKKLIIVVIILFCCVGCDQVTKKVARQTLRHAPPISYFHDCFRLQYTENQGAFLSLGANWSDHIGFWLLIVLPGIVLCGTLLFILLSHKLHPYHIFALSLFVGGGMGNLFDRIVHHRSVIDFMNIGIGPLRTGIFNVADVLIMLGTGGLLLMLFLQYPEKDTSQERSDSNQPSLNV
jgi:signal peptidase II